MPGTQGAGKFIDPPSPHSYNLDMNRTQWALGAAPSVTQVAIANLNQLKAMHIDSSAFPMSLECIESANPDLAPEISDDSRAHGPFVIQLRGRHPRLHPRAGLDCSGSLNPPGRADNRPTPSEPVSASCPGRLIGATE